MVPNVPCGVERAQESEVLKKLYEFRFLMYRVELKDNTTSKSASSKTFVPNAPCGVESRQNKLMTLQRNFSFLMHRVELKALRIDTFHTFLRHLVPNAPCGVERSPQPFPRRVG